MDIYAIIFEKNPTQIYILTDIDLIDLKMPILTKHIVAKDLSRTQVNKFNLSSIEWILGVIN